MVDQSRLLAAPTLALENKTINAALKPILVVRESIKSKAYETFAVSVTDGTRKQVAEEGCLVMGMRERR